MWKDGLRLQSNFFQNTPLSVNAEGERGLLGVAFDPNYASNRFVYVDYIVNTATPHTRISRDGYC